MGTVYGTSLPMPPMTVKSGFIYASCMLASDALTTAMMFWGLSKSKSGWAHTDKVIDRLMRLVIETQSPPTLT